MARLLSVNVGLPRDIAWQGRDRSYRRLEDARQWSAQGAPAQHRRRWTGRYRRSWRRAARRLRLQAELLSILAGAPRSKRTSSTVNSARILPSTASPTGTSASETVTKIGSALFEVTQPRVTCYRLGIRMEEPDMAALLVSHGRPGFYFRVIEEGDVEAGDEIVQVADGPERMSVSEINALLYMPPSPARPPGARAENSGAERRLASFLRGAARAAAKDTTRETPGLAPRSSRLRPGADFARFASRARSPKAAT